MGGKNKKKYKTSISNIDDDKRKLLLEKMKSKKKRFQFVRSCGTGSTQEKHILSRTKEFDDGMIDDLQNEFKNIDKKKAKKYMKSMVKGLGSDEIDQMSSKVGDMNIPNSSAMKNVLQSQKRANEKKKSEEKKTVECKKQIYKPLSEMTVDEKQARRQQRKNDPTKKKKRKKFNQINISIPKPQELVHTHLENDDDNNETSLPPSSTGVSNGNTMQQISDIFSDKMVDSVKTYTPLSYKYKNQKQRLSNLSLFKSKAVLDEMKTYVFTNSHESDVCLITFKTFDMLPMPDIILAPKSTKCPLLGDIPKDVQLILRDVNQNNVLIRKNIVYEIKDGQIYKSRNCVKECKSFITRFAKVFRWLQKLNGMILSKKWFIEKCHSIGIFESVSQPNHFYTHGKEYKDKNKISVAEIPMFQIHIKTI
jgi:hypothetical protein